jgi:hypothetical protein
LEESHHRKDQAICRKVRHHKKRPWKGRNGDTPIGYSGRTALRREQCDIKTHFYATPEIHTCNNRKGIARIVFYVVCVMPIARKRVAKHIPTEAKTWNNRRAIARQRRCKQALSTIQPVFCGVCAKWV